MTKEFFETERLILKPFSMLNEEEKKIVGDSWANPFNARYNEMRDPYGSVEELANLPEPTFSDFNNYYDCMFFRVAFSKENGEIVGTCRFGKYHACENADVWDFGDNVLLKHWFKGYGAEIVSKICDIAKERGALRVRGSADKENYGSYKAMTRNGFEFFGLDEDGDYDYYRDLTKEMPSKEQCDRNWEKHMEMTKTDLGEEKFANLEFINKEIANLVKRIQAGEDEQMLVEEYFERLNAIEQFPMN